MPLKTIEIPTSGPTYEAGAHLLTEIAFAGVLDLRAANFCKALCKLAIELKARRDKEWGLKHQLISPAVVMFTFDSSEFRKSWKVLRERLLVAQYMLFPVIKNKAAGRGGFRLEGYVPTQANMAGLLLDKLGRSRASVSNVKDQMWKPSRPVIHLALAYDFWRFNCGIRDPEEALFQFFFSNDAAAEVIKLAETIREFLPQITELHFSETETIKFTVTDVNV